MAAVTCAPKADRLESWLRDWRLLLLVGLLLLAILFLFPIDLPLGVEWQRTFRAAALDLIAGRDPYANDHFFNAPWTLVPLIPLALLPVKVGRTVFFAASFAAFAYSVRRFGAKPLALAAFLLSPPVVECLLSANVDWMPLLGFVLPPPLGLILIATKPQMGIAVAVFWLAQAWRQGGVGQVVRTFLPVTSLGVLSIGFFGPWFLRSMDALQVGVNASLFPFSIPVGLALLVSSLRKGRLSYAMGASPCLSPYVELHSWAGALMAISPLEIETVAAVAGLWILALMQAR